MSAVDADAAVAHWFKRARLSPLGEGHIHDTYLVEVDGARYVLQRMNHVVFADPELVMAQTSRLLEVWRRQNVYTAPRLVPTRGGELGMWIENEYWRVWEYIADTVVVDPIETLNQARQAGAAFGALQAQLQGLSFEDPIAGFLQLQHYLNKYDQVAGAAPPALQKLIEHHRWVAAELAQRNTLIHGDCKINNLLFDESREKVVAIIDFDTAMYGHWAWDFGDLVRSICFSLGQADVDYFAAALSGFAQQQSRCTLEEVLAAPGYVTLMLGVRFLTDHLSGDRYFRVHRHGQNLVRAEQQFALFESFLDAQPAMGEAARDVLQGS